VERFSAMGGRADCKQWRVQEIACYCCFCLSNLSN
jgi:hypothetical protein